MTIPAASLPARPGARLRARMRGEEGAVLVFWAIALAVVLGMIGLAFDFGRIATTQSELQSYADHVALAAAGELDGNDDAITRAQAAAANLIADTQTFGSGSQALGGGTDYALSFYASLPANDTTAMTGPTADPHAAIYARVVATPKTVPLSFTAAFDALTGHAPPPNAVQAVAVAGFTQYACDVTPLMFCLPSPGYKADDHVGDMILLRSGGNGAAWGPGDFGFLDPADVKVDPNGPCAGLSGAKLDQCRLGAVGNLTQCFSQRGVDTEPGQKVGIENPIFNVRFDIYQSSMSGKKSDANYPPAPNVIKGVVPKGGQSCIGNNPTVSPNTVALPRDTCFGNGSCSRFGDGNWSTGRANYVAKNYGTADPHASAATRYQYYLAEIASAGGGGSKTSILTGRAETGRPQCSPNQSPDPDRRIVIAAGIDCGANPIKGSANDVPVAEFFRLFLTEPVGTDPVSPSILNLWVEVEGSAETTGASNTAGLFHDVVQLYR